MVTQTYICDDCKQSVGKEDLCSIEVSIGFNEASYTRRGKSLKKDICKDCLRKRDMLVESQDGVAVEPAIKTSTFEKKFMDFLVDLGVMFEE
jgi:hypothetical protein